MSDRIVHVSEATKQAEEIAHSVVDASEEMKAVSTDVTQSVEDFLGAVGVR